MKGYCETKQVLSNFETTSLINAKYLHVNMSFTTNHPVNTQKITFTSGYHVNLNFNFTYDVD